MLGENSKVAVDYGAFDIPTVWLVLPDGKLANATVDGLAEQIARHRQAAGRRDEPSGGDAPEHCAVNVGKRHVSRKPLKQPDDPKPTQLGTAGRFSIARETVPDPVFTSW